MTNTTTHTPGPWKITADEFIDDAKGGPVARIYSRQTRGSEEVAANATLIAAAPELLAALELLVGTYDWKGDGPGQFKAKLVAWDAVRAAIAKAKGQS